MLALKQLDMDHARHQKDLHLGMSLDKEINPLEKCIGLWKHWCIDIELFPVCYSLLQPLSFIDALGHPL